MRTPVNAESGCERAYSHCMDVNVHVVTDARGPWRKGSSKFVCFWRDSPHWARASSFTRFLDHTQWHTIVGRTPLDEWSARRREFYLTTHTSYSRQTSMPPEGFEPTISAGGRPQTYTLDRAATGTSVSQNYPSQIKTEMDRKFIVKFFGITSYQNTLPFPAIVYGQTDKRTGGQNNFNRSFAKIEMLLKWCYRKQKLE